MLLPISEDDSYTVNNPSIAWVSGITAGVLDDATGDFVCVGTLEEQTSKAYANLEKVLARSGHTLNDVVKMIYYIDPVAVKSFNQAIGVRAELFGIDQLPAVTAVAIHSLLQKGALVNIEAVADREGKRIVHYPDRRNDWKLPYKPCWDGGNVLWPAGTPFNFVHIEKEGVDQILSFCASHQSRKLPTLYPQSDIEIHSPSFYHDIEDPFGCGQKTPGIFKQHC